MTASGILAHRILARKNVSKLPTTAAMQSSASLFFARAARHMLDTVHYIPQRLHHMSGILQMWAFSAIFCAAN
jgi:hypothetical protein